MLDRARDLVPIVLAVDQPIAELENRQLAPPEQCNAST
jgi:hypothetical protein